METASHKHEEKQSETNLNSSKQDQETKSHNGSKIDHSKETHTSTKSSSSKDIEELDINTPMWFYQDSAGMKQGPFSFKEMFLWWKGGYFRSDLPVKTVWEDNFSQLGEIAEFYNAPPKLIERIEKEQEKLLMTGHVEIPLVPTYYEEPQPELSLPHPPPLQIPDFHEYSVAGGFNPLNGKFQKDDSAAYFTNKGIPSDKDFRMMSNYFDHEQYQIMQQQAKGQPTDDKKKKGTKKFWKERKEKKKRAKLIAEYLAD